MPIKSDGGKVLRLMCITQDVTEQRRMVQELAASGERLEFALRGARQGLWDLDVESGHLVINEDWAQIFGYTAVELKPTVQTLWGMCHPDDVAGVRDAIIEHLKGATGRFESTHRMRHKNGQWRWIVDRAAVVERSEEGRALRLTGTTMDVTESYLAAERQRELEARLAQAQKMEGIGQLAGGIAHDFNNLLTVISGNVELCLADAGVSPALRRRLMEIQRAAEDSSAFIADLLTFSKSRVTRLKVVSLNGAIEDSLAMIRHLLPESIELRFEPGELPPVAIDVSKIRQILVNLCVNASDAMSDGGVLLIKSEVPAEQTGCVRLLVKDNGQGMDESTRTQAFDPFFTTKKNNDGTGLGLTMVYWCAQQHQGHVEIDSRPGEGTTVRVTLPIDFDGAHEVADETKQAAPMPQTATVLVVEDEKRVRSVARAMLESAGFKVLEAADGAAGVEAFKANANDIDVVFLDVVMPCMNGAEAFKAIREIRPDVAVLFTTGYNQNNALPPELVTKHDLEVLAKPYTTQELTEAVRELLVGREKTRTPKTRTTHRL